MTTTATRRIWTTEDAARWAGTNPVIAIDPARVSEATDAQEAAAAACVPTALPVYDALPAPTAVAVDALPVEDAVEVTDAEVLAEVYADPLLTALYEDGRAAAAMSWAWERMGQLRR